MAKVTFKKSLTKAAALAESKAGDGKIYFGSDEGIVLEGVLKAEVNKIDSLSVNGVAASIDNKAATVTIDGADVKLDGYSKAETSSAIAATDTVNAALGKLEKGLEDVGGDAITLVEAGNGVSVSEKSNHKQTVSAKVKSGDSYIEVTADGIASKGIDGAISTAVSAAKTELKGVYATAQITDETIAGAKKYADVAAASAVSGLDLAQTTGDYVVWVSQEDGQLAAASADFVDEIGEDPSTNNAPTVSAVKTYVDGAVSAEASARDTAIAAAIKTNVTDREGVASGLATLGSDGKVPTSQIPDAILGQMMLGGSFDANGIATVTSNLQGKLKISDATIQLINSATDDKTQNPKEYGYKTLEGVFFLADANFTIGEVEFQTGDWLVGFGTKWAKIDNTDAVTGVKGSAETEYRIGNVNITAANIGLGNVDNTADAAKPVSTAQATAIAAAESAAKTYADTIKVNGQSQSSQAITITGANVNVGGSGSHKDATVAASIEDLYTKATTGLVESVSKGTDGNYFTTTIAGTATNPTVAGAVTVQAVADAGSEAKGLAEASDVKNFVGTEIGKLSHTSTGKGGSYIQKVSEANGVITETVVAFDSAVDPAKTDNAPNDKAVAVYVKDQIELLDATVSQSASAANGQLALQVVEADGKLTSVSGSIAANTYDAYGSAAAAETAAKNYADGLDAAMDARMDVVEACLTWE